LRWGRGRDLNSGERLHRPLCCQATSPRPLFLSKLAPRPFLPSFRLGFHIVIANTLFSFAEFFPYTVVIAWGIFIANVDWDICLFNREGYLCCDLFFFTICDVILLKYFVIAKLYILKMIKMVDWLGKNFVFAQYKKMEKYKNKNNKK
jgi:hypothetical protein